MFALGHKRTSEHVCAMSALPPKADIGTEPRNVRFVPKADIQRWIKARRSYSRPGEGIVHECAAISTLPTLLTMASASTAICNWQDELKRRATDFTVRRRGKFTAMIFNDHSGDG